MKLLKRASAFGLIAATIALGSMSVNAAPAVNSAQLSKSANSSLVTQVQERRNRGEWRGKNGGGGEWRRGGRGDSGEGRRGRYRNYDNGWNPGAYIGLGIAGAVLDGALSDGYAESDGYYDGGDGYASGDGNYQGMRRCAAQFRSFEPDTGLYTTYEGDKRMCPYLG